MDGRVLKIVVENLYYQCLRFPTALRTGGNPISTSTAGAKDYQEAVVDGKS